MGPPADATRYHALDVARGMVMLILALGHGAIAYMVVAVPKLAWHVRDASTWRGADVLVWWIHAFSMQLFLFMAGFLAARSYAAYGPAGFAANRWRRIGLPFLAACFVVLPVMYVVWGAGWVHSGRATVDELLHRAKFHDRTLRKEMAGPAHLWFLEYLLLMYAGYLALRVAWGRLPEAFRARLARSAPARVVDRLLLPPTGFLAPAIASGAAILLDPSIYMVLKNTFRPNGAVFAFYVGFFAYGCWMHRHAADLRRFAAGGWVYAAASVAAYAWVFDVVGRHPSGHFAGADRWELAAAASLSASLTVFAIFGLLLRYADRPRKGLRWFSDAAFWVYLVHLPVVGAFQLLLVDVSAPGWAKLLATVVGTYAVCFLSYRWFVRPTRLGVWLGGPPIRPPTPA